MAREMWAPDSVCALCGTEIAHMQDAIVLLNEAGLPALVHQAACAPHFRAQRAAALWRSGARCEACRDRIQAAGDATVIWVAGRHEHLVHRAPACANKMLARALRAVSRQARFA